MVRQHKRIVLQQILKAQLARTFESDDRFTGRSGDFQGCPGTQTATQFDMTHDLHKLADVSQVMRHRCAGKHVRQIELVSGRNAELMRGRAARIHDDSVVQPAVRSRRAAAKGSCSTAQELPGGP